MIAASSDRALRSAISQWLLHAEHETRVAFAQVQRDGSDPCRARYAAARRERDLAERVLTHMITWPRMHAASS